MDCVLVGPETSCFCTHRYRQHKTDFATIPPERPIPQPCSKCKCKGFHLLPRMIGGVVRCHCKHEATEHKVVSELSPTSPLYPQLSFVFSATLSASNKKCLLPVLVIQFFSIRLPLCLQWIDNLFLYHRVNEAAVNN